MALGTSRQHSGAAKKRVDTIPPTGLVPFQGATELAAEDERLGLKRCLEDPKRMKTRMDSL